LRLGSKSNKTPTGVCLFVSSSPARSPFVQWNNQELFSILKSKILDLIDLISDLIHEKVFKNTNLLFINRKLFWVEWKKVPMKK